MYERHPRGNNPLLWGICRRRQRRESSSHLIRPTRLAFHRKLNDKLAILGTGESPIRRVSGRMRRLIEGERESWLPTEKPRMKRAEGKLVLWITFSLFVCLSFSKSLDGEIMRDWAKIGVNVSRYRLLLSEFFFSSFIISRENIIGILMKRKKRCSNRISFSVILLTIINNYWNWATCLVSNSCWKSVFTSFSRILSYLAYKGK